MVALGASYSRIACRVVIAGMVLGGYSGIYGEKYFLKICDSRLTTFVFLALAVAPLLQAGDFTLLATPSTVVWGYYSARAKPALTVKSGDTVRMQTLSTCAPDRMAAAGVAVPQYDLDIHEKVTDRGPGGHILTGPVAIEEAEPGDVLEVQIQKIQIDVPWACNSFGPGRGFLPYDF